MGRPGTRSVEQMAVLKRTYAGSEMVGLRIGRLAGDEKSPESSRIHLFPILMTV